MEVIITDVVWINKTPTRLLINQQESLWLSQPLSHQFCQLGQTGGSRPVVRRPHCQLGEGRGQGWGGD